MANFLIGLDFGTSQTKVCLLNEDSSVREFIKFENDSCFLPSLIVKKLDNTFSYGDESVNGKKYRYFKMAAAEDDDLVKITNENLEGILDRDTNYFRKYSTSFDIEPEKLVVLYLSFVYLYIKKEKATQKNTKIGGLLGRLGGNRTISKNTFSVNLGIPTEWNNPNHIKRKIKFQSLLVSSITLANGFESLDEYKEAKEAVLLKNISEINSRYLKELENKTEEEKISIVNNWLDEKKLTVFPESAAGVNYLLKTNRLENGKYATLDIGAGTSDIAIFEVRNHNLQSYYCSESVSIASNDFYREYAKQLYKRKNIVFDEVKKVENIIRNDNGVDSSFYTKALRIVRGNFDGGGIEFAIRKMLYRKFFLPFPDKEIARNVLSTLENNPIIIFGGGASIEGLCNGKFCYYRAGPIGNNDKTFITIPITNYVVNVDISNDENEIRSYINLLVLALGLTYRDQNNGEDRYIPFAVKDIQLTTAENTLTSTRYFYYDIQDAVYK